MTYIIYYKNCIQAKHDKMYYFKIIYIIILISKHSYHYICNIICLFNFRIAGHPLAQNERCLHMFLQEPVIDKNYVPGKIRNT